MNVQKRNDVTIYCLSSGPTMPEWLGERARRNLSKRDEQVRRRIELIQDFQMPSSSSKVVQSADGRYIIAAGTYPPRIRCYDVHELTMKFERYVNSHVLDMVMLGEDYGKMALLLDDRTISFQAHYGNHEAIRVPTFGRGMAYEPTTCELLVAAKGNQIYRINLEEGRFSESWSFDSQSDEVVSGTCISVASCQPLASVGCDDGIVRFWDNRSPDTLLKPFLKLDVKSATNGYGYADTSDPSVNPHEITSIAHDVSGLNMAVGTAGGLVALYDIRTSRPLHIKEHKHGIPIHTVKFHPGSGCVMSADEKLVKAWRYKSGGDIVNTKSSIMQETLTSSLTSSNNHNNNNIVSQGLGAVVANIETSGGFTNFIMAGDENDPTGNNSGLLLCATNQPKLESYYIPKIGLAPKWCSFLENITEELEERDLNRAANNNNNNNTGTLSSDLVRDGQESIYENYKFVSRDELEKLGVSNLIGTPLLRGYMHGFFMDINLYNKVRAVANPFEYEEYRKKKLKERMEAKRASRIAPRATNNNKKTAVNTELAERLQSKAQDSSKAGKIANKMLQDDRFGNLFSNPDYEIDEEDDNFKLRNPSGIAAHKRKKRDDMDSDSDDDAAASIEGDIDHHDNLIVNDEDEQIGFRRVGNDDEDDYDNSESDASDSDSDDEDGFRGAKVRGEAYHHQIKSSKHKKVQSKKNNKNKNKAVMYEADSNIQEDAIKLFGGKGLQKETIRNLNLPLNKRLAMQAQEDSNVTIRNVNGSKELTFIPKDSRKKMQQQQNDNDDGVSRGGRGGGGKRQRRGIKDLKLKTPFKNSS